MGSRNVSIDPLASLARLGAYAGLDTVVKLDKSTMTERHIAPLLVLCLATALIFPRGLQAAPAPAHAAGSSGGAAGTGASGLDWETAAKIAGGLVSAFALIAMFYKLAYLILGSLLTSHKVTRGHVLDAIFLELALNPERRDRLWKLLSDQSVSARIPEGGEPAVLAGFQDVLRRSFAPPVPASANGPGPEAPGKKKRSPRASKPRAGKPSARASRTAAKPASRPQGDAPARRSGDKPEDT
jgi:hypothetical protein